MMKYLSYDDGETSLPNVLISVHVCFCGLPAVDNELEWFLAFIFY